jgi:ABC-type transport system substrate-binding protein
MNSIKTSRRTAAKTLAAALGLGAGFPGASAQPAGRPLQPGQTAQKVLRWAFPAAETGFDPARIVDLYSRTITPHIFEGLYGYDHLARPPKVVPLVAEGMPEVSADFKTWTIKIKRGIFFASDAAFKGGKRELVATDFVYSWKRPADPAIKSPIVGGLLSTGYIGLKALRDDAQKNKKPFDYDKPIEGIRALDRHTIQFNFEEPRPGFMDTLSSSDLFGAVAREVVEMYGEDIPAHPVGTGPFKLVQWRRSSLIVLERNPEYREVLWSAEPPADDPDAQAIAKRLSGKRIPMVDRVEVSIIEETQPRWLAFLNNQLDLISVPAEFVNTAMPNGKVAANLARRGIQGNRQLNADSAFIYFNMEDPVVGGYTPDKVALRRAIGLGIDLERLIAVVYRGQAVPAQSILVPHTSGYDPKFRSANSDFDPGRAKALLDIHGYVDKNGDGYRELPDGKPLTLQLATQPDALSRVNDELWKKNMDRIGIKLEFFIGKWPEQLKAARAGKLQLWALGSSAAGVDGLSSLQRLYGPESGSANIARFKNAEFDRIYERMQEIADGPEREKLFEQAKRISVAYLPYKINVHRISNTLMQPQLIGYRRPVFWQEWWHMVDIDPSARRG